MNLPPPRPPTPTQTPKPPPSPPAPRWRRWLNALWQWPLALVILFEEWGWVPLQRLLARIGRWPGFRWIEGWVRSLPPWAALALLLLPSLLLLPVKLLALWLISQGRGVLGALVIVVAKLVGTALLARIFSLTQPALMQMPWFARWHGRWTTWKDGLLARVRASAVWQSVGRVKAAARAAASAAARALRAMFGR